MSIQSGENYILLHPDTGTVLFDSNDVLNGDHMIEAHPHLGEQRNFFLLEKDAHGHFTLKNTATNRYVFVSNDKKAGDNVVESHNGIESRNGFVFEPVGPEQFKIFHPQTGLYLFVSNDIEKGDRVVEAHSAAGESRNIFKLLQAVK